MTVSGTRPAAHWDATFTEDLSSNSISKAWTLHVGGSFPDVPTSNQFYSFIENLFHNGVTGGCGGGNYCPDASVTRAQMAVFLLKGKLGASHVPPPATGTVFSDVHGGDPSPPTGSSSWPASRSREAAAAATTVPNNPVTRAQMAVFLLKAEHGSAYTPPACTGIFADVACPSQFADWIEQLVRRRDHRRLRRRQLLPRTAPAPAARWPSSSSRLSACSSMDQPRSSRGHRTPIPSRSRVPVQSMSTRRVRSTSTWETRSFGPCMAHTRRLAQTGTRAWGPSPSRTRSRRSGPSPTTAAGPGAVIVHTPGTVIVDP